MAEQICGHVFPQFRKGKCARATGQEGRKLEGTCPAKAAPHPLHWGVAEEQPCPLSRQCFSTQSAGRVGSNKQ